MRTIDLVTPSARPESTHSAPTLRWELSEQIGLPAFKAGVLSPFERHAGTSLPAAELDGVVGACRSLDARINRELKLRPGHDPVVPVLRELRGLTEVVRENLLSRDYFERQLAAHARGERPDLEPLGRSMMALAVESCTEHLAGAIEQVKALPLPERPVSYRIVEGAKVLVAVAALLALPGGTATRSEPFPAIPVSPVPPPVVPAVRAVAYQPQPGAVAAGARAANPDHHDETLSPDIEPGLRSVRSEHGVKISFPLFSTVPDHLWIGPVYARSPAGDFQRIDREVTCIESDTEATVTRSLSALTGGSTVLTPTPFGFGAHRVTLTDSSGAPIPFTFDPARGVVQLREGNGTTAGTLTYQVTEARESLGLPEPSPVAMLRPALHERVIAALRADPSRVEEALEVVCREYVYLTSASVGNALRLLRSLNQEEVFSNIGFADCDSASVVAAGILNEAGIPAGVIAGEVESSGRFRSRHAKVVYLDQSGQYQTWETTSRMRDFLYNLELSAADQQRLYRLAVGIQEAGDAPRRVEAYARFREELTEMVAKPEYARFRRETDPEGSGERTLATNALDFREGLDFERRDLLDLGLMMGGVLTLAAGTFLTLRSASRRFHEGALERATGGIATPLNTPASPGAPLTPEVEQLSTNINGAVESSLSRLERRRPGIRDEFAGTEELDLEQRQMVLRYLNVLETLGPDSFSGPFYSMRHIRYVLRMRRHLEETTAHPASVQRVFDTAVAETLDPRKIALHRAKLPEEVERIMSDALKLTLSARGVAAPSQGRDRPTTASSRQRSYDRSDEFYGYRELQPGESVDSVDWRASARSDRLVAREFRAPKMLREDPRQPVHLVIDLNGAYHRDYLCLAVVLLSNGGARRLESLSICANGELVRTYDARMLSRSLTGAGNAPAVRTLLTALLERQLELGLQVPSDATRDHDALMTLQSDSACYFPARLLRREGEVVVFGNYHFRNTFDTFGQLVPRRRSAGARG